MAGNNSAGIAPGAPNVIKLVVTLIGFVGLLLAEQGSSFAAAIDVSVSAQTQIDQAIDAPGVALIRAREKSNATQRDYEVLKNLSEQGSASQRDLRLANLRRRVALLDYSSLVDPTRQEKNLLLKARVVLQFRNQELAVAKGLYERGSVSRVSYLRSVAARDIAESNLKAIKSVTETQRKLQLVKVARSRLNVAEEEFAIAQRLFHSNSISQPEMDRATSNLKVAVAELESSKKSLGARATRVRQ